jgi:thiol-disulfide isomerase/thioredoxin
MRSRHGAAIAAGSALAFLAACGGTPPPVVSNAPPAKTVAASNTATAGAKDPKAAKLTNADGSTFTIADVAGKAKVVNVWATWCAPCIKEMPLLNELSAKFKDQGVTFVAVSIDEEGAAKVEPFLKKGVVKVDFRVAYATQDELKAMNVEVPIPDTVVLDANNNVVEHFDKVIEKEELERAIVRALGSAK